MSDEGLMLGDVHPEWMRDGGDLIGDQNAPEYDEGFRQWNTTCYSTNEEADEDFIGGGCG